MSDDKMNRPKVDPIHFFDERGNALVNVDHLYREIERLAKEVHERDLTIARLQGRLSALLRGEDLKRH